MKAMILSAGRGERLRPLTDSTPKPLIKVGEYTLIEYHLFALAKAGFKDVVINVSYHPQQFLKILGDGSRYGVKIHYSFEPENGGLETGGGIFQALSLLGKQPFLAISADLWTDYPFHKLPQKISDLAHLVLVDNPPYHSKGDFCLENNLIKEDGATKLNFGGIGIYSPELFNNCQPGKYSVVPLLTAAMRKNKVTGEYYQGEWMNIGTMEQLKILKDRLTKKVME